MKLRLFLCYALSGTVFAQGMPSPSAGDNSVYSTASANVPTPSVSGTLYEILGRLEQLQVEVQNLRGQVEEQAYTIKDLQKRQNSIYSDLDQRLQTIETAASQSQPEASAAAVAETAGPTMPVSSEPAAQPSPPAVVAVAPNAPAQPQKTVVDESEKQRYQQAYETLRNGHYSKAIAAFKQFLNDYPAGEYADNAQYWLGETYKVSREVGLAREAFNQLVSQFPNSPKVPDALLKLGYIELEQSNLPKARDYFTQITATYPGTAAARLAEQKLQQLN